MFDLLIFNNDNIHKLSKYYPVIYYSVISLLFCVNNRMPSLNWVFTVLIALVMVSGIKNNLFYPSYFVVMFYEYNNAMPIGGSYVRLYLLIFITAVIYDALMGKKIEIEMNVLLRFGAFLISVFLIKSSLFKTADYVINGLIITYISLKMINDNQLKERVLISLAVSSAFTSLYGIVFPRYDEFDDPFRYFGFIDDPNYSALFYSLGLFSLVGISDNLKIFKICTFMIIVFGLSRTVSFTGYIATFLVFYIYFYIVNKKYAKRIAIATFALALLIIIVPMPKGTFLNGIQMRINYKLMNADNYTNTLSMITSERSDIWYSYLLIFKKLPLISKLFGGNNTVSGHFRSICVNIAGDVSHNSFIDMMFMSGIVMTVILVAVMIKSMIERISEYKKNNDILSLSIALLKLTVVFYGLTISFFPYKYFYTFIII